MRAKALMITVLLALFFLAPPQIARAQKDGEAQLVVFDGNKYPTLLFANKQVAERRCALAVSYTLMDNQEEAFVIGVGHLHFRTIGKPTIPERGWLYITPSRIVFVVTKGDKSHAFDVPRTALEDKPATSEFFRIYPALQINLKERLPASNSREQKFAFPLYGEEKCTVHNTEPFTRFLERAVNDFNGAMAEFKRVADALKQSAMPVRRPEYSGGMPAAYVNITSEPAGAEIYADGRLEGRTPSRILLGVGERTIKVTKPGYQDWERKIVLEYGRIQSFNAILEKQ